MSVGELADYRNESSVEKRVDVDHPYAERAVYAKARLDDGAGGNDHADVEPADEQAREIHGKHCPITRRPFVVHLSPKYSVVVGKYNSLHKKRVGLAGPR